MKILVAIDQGEFRFQIIESLAKRHWPNDTKFKLLSVIEPLPFHWEQIGFDEWEKTAQEILEKRKQATNKILAEARDLLLKAHSDIEVHTELRYGKALNEIVFAAAEWDAEKLIMGAHGRQQNRLLAGAVSYSVPHHADCSVELVKLHPLHTSSAKSPKPQKAEIEKAPEKTAAVEHAPAKR